MHDMDSTRIWSVSETSDLKHRMREVTLLRSSEKPYRNCYISIECLDPHYLVPCQRYVLVKEIRKIQQLRWQALQEGTDIFTLWGAFKFDGHEIIPPVIEEHVINGRIYPIICDGQHRTYLAYQLNSRINVVYIRGVSVPYYASVLPHGWNDVEIIDELTEGYIKKFHVIQDHKTLFRDFTSQFDNLSVSRKRQINK